MEEANNKETKKRSVSETMFDCGLLMIILSWAVAIVNAMLPEKK